MHGVDGEGGNVVLFSRGLVGAVAAALTTAYMTVTWSRRSLTALVNCVLTIRVGRRVKIYNSIVTKPSVKLLRQLRARGCWKPCCGFEAASFVTPGWGFVRNGLIDTTTQGLLPRALVYADIIAVPMMIGHWKYVPVPK